MGRHWHIPVVDNNFDLVADTYFAVVGFVAAEPAVGQVAQQSDFAMLIVVPAVDMAQPYKDALH